jgi:hypothetical protein
MPLQDEVAREIELEHEIFDEAAVSEASQIEEVLNRAHQIHRAHGGLFGYDLEDWLQAEREFAERNRTADFGGRGNGVSDPWIQQSNCQGC